MEERIQGRRKKVRSYVLDKVLLCVGLKIDVASIRRVVAKGLWQQNEADHLPARDFLSTNAILQAAVEYEAVEEARRGRIGEDQSRFRGNQA